MVQFRSKDGLIKDGPAGSTGADEARPDERPPAVAASGSAAIATQLRNAILEGTYAYGDRLPPERELAEHFGAARSTVREALRRLEDQGLVERRVGSGTFVTHSTGLGATNIADVTSPLELIEVRLAVEPHLVRLAVLHATGRDLDGMEEVLRRLEACGGDREAFSREDEQFHLALAECTRNPLMSWLYQQINEVRGHRQWNAMKTSILTAPRIAEYNRQHRQLFELLKSRDVEGAVAVMTEHLEEARRDLLGAQGASVLPKAGL